MGFLATDCGTNIAEALVVRPVGTGSFTDPSVVSLSVPCSIGEGDGLGSAFAVVPDLLGAGNIALNPELPPPIRSFFVGGPSALSSCVSSFGRLTINFLGPAATMSPSWPAFCESFGFGRRADSPVFLESEDLWGDGLGFWSPESDSLSE